MVDDGSTDATAEVARRYPVQLISQSNSGLSAASNAGIRASRGTDASFLSHGAWVIAAIIQTRFSERSLRPMDTC